MASRVGERRQSHSQYSLSSNGEITPLSFQRIHGNSQIMEFVESHDVLKGHDIKKKKIKSLCNVIIVMSKMNMKVNLFYVKLVFIHLQI